MPEASSLTARLLGLPPPSFPSGFPDPRGWKTWISKNTPQSPKSSVTGAGNLPSSFFVGRVGSGCRHHLSWLRYPLFFNLLGIELGPFHVPVPCRLRWSWEKTEGERRQWKKSSSLRASIRLEGKASFVHGVCLVAPTRGRCYESLARSCNWESCLQEQHKTYQFLVFAIVLWPKKF